jgi:hypothetical protein
MTSAKDIALSAAAQAREAATLEAAHEEALAMERARQKDEDARKDVEAALTKLNEWFPGVEWVWQRDGDEWGWQRGGDYGFDTIVWDASETWPPSFLLLVGRHGPHGVTIKVGDYTTGSDGYSYFSGGIIKGPADVGRYLEAIER